jgi:hypothetical protein
MMAPRNMWWALSNLLFKVLPIVMSVVALYVSLRDRRPKLLLQSRKSCGLNVYRLRHALTGRIAFMGGVEVYNRSARANAIRGYAFWCKNESGEWIPMESQNYHERSNDGSVEERNPTPVALPPYSGTEVKVMAFAEQTGANEMNVRIEIEDLFGKRYRIEVCASVNLLPPDMA